MQSLEIKTTRSNNVVSDERHVSFGKVKFWSFDFRFFYLCASANFIIVDKNESFSSSFNSMESLKKEKSKIVFSLPKERKIQRMNFSLFPLAFLGSMGAEVKMKKNLFNASAPSLRNIWNNKSE